jgi:hypothetical protein
MFTGNFFFLRDADRAQSSADSEKDQLNIIPNADRCNLDATKHKDSLRGDKSYRKEQTFVLL